MAKTAWVFTVFCTFLSFMVHCLQEIIINVLQLQTPSIRDFSTVLIRKLTFAPLRIYVFDLPKGLQKICSERNSIALALDRPKDISNAKGEKAILHILSLSRFDKYILFITFYKEINKELGKKSQIIHLELPF